MQKKCQKTRIIQKEIKNEKCRFKRVGSKESKNNNR